MNMMNIKSYFIRLLIFLCCFLAASDFRSTQTVIIWGQTKDTDQIKELVIKTPLLKLGGVFPLKNMEPSFFERFFLRQNKESKIKEKFDFLCKGR